MDPIQMLLDENCTDNIVLYGENGKPMEFEQIALIPIEEQGVFVILKPVGDGILQEDEALVFQLMKDEEGIHLEVCMDDASIDRVFDEYNRLLNEM